MSDKYGQRKEHNHIARDLRRFLWCGLGAATGNGLALWYVGIPSSPYLLASLGGSTVLLFGLTHSAAAQPRALFGGHLGSALLGIHTSSGSCPHFHACHKDCTSTSRSKPPDHGATACRFHFSLATGQSWHNNPCLGRFCLEPYLARHESLPHGVVQRVTTF
jgi:hypothetical protein